MVEIKGDGVSPIVRAMALQMQGWADGDLGCLPQQTQSPKSQNASQTGDVSLDGDLISFDFVEDRLSLSRDPTPIDPAREFEDWFSKPTSSIDGRRPSSHGDESLGQRTGAITGHTRSQSLTALEQAGYGPLRTAPVVGVPYGANPCTHSQSHSQHRNETTSKDVRRSFNGSRIRRVSRGRQPQRSPRPASYRLYSSASSTVSKDSRAILECVTRRAASWATLPPLGSSTTVLDVALRSRSFSRERPTWDGNIMVNSELGATQNSLDELASQKVESDGRLTPGERRETRQPLAVHDQSGSGETDLLG
ncbi:hypothetical protein GQ53DRAFT_440615 [Thozetella sp. PMI_491]|nr:hypothetical protein GQ53DRAFT_440615 [Thozetella sp. PMI_491]